LAVRSPNRGVVGKDISPRLPPSKGVDFLSVFIRVIRGKIRWRRGGLALPSVLILISPSSGAGRQIFF